MVRVHQCVQLNCHFMGHLMAWTRQTQSKAVFAEALSPVRPYEGLIADRTNAALLPPKSLLE